MHKSRREKKRKEKIEGGRDKGRKRMNRDFTENTSVLAASLERSFSRYNHHTKEPFGSDDYVHNIRLGENSSA